MPGPQIIEEQKQKERRCSEEIDYTGLKYITAIRIDYDFEPMIAEYGLWKVLWGYDVFFGKVPMFKTILFVDILVLLLILFSI